MKLVATIENDAVLWDADRRILRFKGRGRIDDDGTGSAHGDKYHQRETSLRQNGRSLNADVDRYMVVPEQLIMGLPGIFLGSQAFMTYQGTMHPLVVGDAGPRNRLGEISEKAAEVAGINDNPNSGGDDEDDILFEIHVGVPAVVDGVHYTLQSA